MTAISAALYLTVVACPDPAALLRETIELSKANAQKSVNWLAREDIKRTDPNKSNKLVSWETYEASRVEGENYYRLVARSGKPLNRAEVQRERLKLERESEYRRTTPVGQRAPRTASNRYSMSIRHLLDHHELQCSGEDVTPEGRKYWIIDTRVGSDAPGSKGRGDMSLTGDVTLWIDQETKLAWRQELRVTRSGGWAEGSQIVYEMFWNGEVMLVGKIHLRIVGPGGRNTEQVYSSYRKFASSSDIKFEAQEIR